MVMCVVSSELIGYIGFKPVFNILKSVGNILGKPLIQGEMQRENKLILYERAFKILYTCILLRSVKPF